MSQGCRYEWTRQTLLHSWEIYLFHPNLTAQDHDAIRWFQKHSTQYQIFVQVHPPLTLSTHPFITPPICTTSIQITFQPLTQSSSHICTNHPYPLPHPNKGNRVFDEGREGSQFGEFTWSISVDFVPFPFRRSLRMRYRRWVRSFVPVLSLSVSSPYSLFLLQNVEFPF
jgi:hypothetical protein